MKSEKAEIGDVIKCMGISRRIGRIVSQYQDDGHWNIEAYDDKGKIFTWKQRWDGGKLFTENNELKEALTIEERHELWRK